MKGRLALMATMMVLFVIVNLVSGRGHRPTGTAAPGPSAGVGGAVGSSLPPSASASVTAAGLDPLDPNTLISDAVHNLTSGPGYRVVFKGIDRYGPAAFDVTTDGHGHLAGMVTTRGLTGQILLSGGSLYLHGPQLVSLLMRSNGRPAPPAGAADGWAWISADPPGNGFFDGLASPGTLLDYCIRPGGAETLSTGATTSVAGRTSSVTVIEGAGSSISSAVLGRLLVADRGGPSLVRWTITGETGIQSTACPGGEEAGVSANLFVGTLDFSPVTSLPAMAVPANPYTPIPHDTFSKDVGGA